MLTLTNKHWYIIWSIIALILGVLSLGLDWYPQFPSMCIILGIILGILVDTLEPIPAIKRHHWYDLYADLRAGKVDIGRAFLLLHAKLIFPTLFTIYLILLIMQKVKVVPADWQSYATSAIDTLQLLWVTLISAVLANFTGLPDHAYEIEHESPWANTLTIILVCLLAYGSMWSIFAEIAVIGRVAYFVSLSVGVLIALVSFMILTEPDEEEESKMK
jgi:hypothetical protein